MSGCVIPGNFEEFLAIENAAERLAEAKSVADSIVAAGVSLLPNLDHAAIFTDPPHLVAGPMKQLGYVSGWDARSYPSPVDGRDYINVSGRLPVGSSRRAEGWPDYIAVVHPVDLDAREHMLGQGYGNPFIHHLTWGVIPPSQHSDNDIEYTRVLIRFMARVRGSIGAALQQTPGTLIIALPPAVIDSPELEVRIGQWTSPLKPSEYQIEVMEGGGYLLQFFVLTGGRIELALRVGTRQTFNPKSVDKISRDEISAVQSPPV